MGEKTKTKTVKKKKDAPAVWFSLKKSLHCKSEPSDVYDPTAQKQLDAILTRKPARSGCSRSIANLKDVVIHGSKRHLERPPNCSPRSIGSSDFLNPITHDVIFSTSKCELKIGAGGGSAYVGALSPGTPCNSVTKRELGFGNCGLSPNTISASKIRVSFDDTDESNYAVNCHKCGDRFAKLDALESHFLSRHAVTELVEGDSSRKIVEIICRSNVKIDRVLKIHNMARTLALFEDYREAVKTRASKLAKKHPRCLADGNELLRFHGASLACGLGGGGVCSGERCGVCRIIREGFGGRRGVGVYTAATSDRAYEGIRTGEGERKALVVCRVIAGRVHRPVEEMGGGVSLAGFDSLVGKVGVYSNIEELYLLNPRALLPCFVVICKP